MQRSTYDAARRGAGATHTRLEQLEQSGAMEPILTLTNSNLTYN